MNDDVSSLTASTGIEGLDDILCGGLPRGRTYLVEGDPGTGKTTLGLHFLRAGARVGERVLYVTLAETEGEIRAVAASHGWALDGVDIFAYAPFTQGTLEDDYSVFFPAEVELTQTTDALVREIDRAKPSRVVVDTLSELRLVAQHPLRYRRQLTALKQRFSGSAITVLLLDDFVGSEEPDQQMESLAHGVIQLEQQVPKYGRERRRLRIKKLRGLAFRGGYHDFDIATGEIRVFPRLVAAEHPRGVPSELVSSGLASFDALLGGGIDRGSTTLIWGPAGSGKSSLSTLFMLAAAKREELVAAFLFDESVASFFQRASGLGMGLSEHERAGRAKVRAVDPAELSPGEFVHLVRQHVERDHARIVLIDSLNGYLSAMPDEGDLLPHLRQLFSYLNQKGVVTVIAAAQHGVVGSRMEAPVDMSYLADTVVLLRYFEAEGRMRNAIAVQKKRRGRHEHALRELTLGEGGPLIGEPLSQFHGILTGVPHYRGTTASLDAARRDP